MKRKRPKCRMKIASRRPPSRRKHDMFEILGRLLSLMRRVERHLCRHSEGLSAEDKQALDDLQARSAAQLKRLQALDALNS